MPENKYRNRLYQLRKAHQMSQEEVFTKLNINRRSLYKYEHCLCAVPSDKLVEFARLYKCSTDFILCFDSESDNKNE